MSSSNAPVCAVTGAHGFLGSRVCEVFENKGWRVYKLVRTRTTGEKESDTVVFSLDQIPDVDDFRSRDIRVLIHCAYDFSPASWQEIHRVNVEGSLRLFEAAQAGGVERIIYISSTSAHDHARSFYGKAKLEIEKYVLAHGGEVVRPGLIFSERSGGMMGKIQRIAASSYIVPVIGHPQNPIYLTNREDVVNLICYLATKAPSNHHLWVAASPEPWTLSQIVKHIAKTKGKKILVIPIPWMGVWALLKVIESLGIRLSFRSDSILGLVYSAISFPKEEVPPITFRNFGEMNS